MVTHSNYNMCNNPIDNPPDYHDGGFSPAVIIFRLIISRNITTLVNYRMAVPVRSDFLAYNNFPEV